MFRVYVGNLPYKVRNQELRDYFTQCGEVKDAIVPLNGDHRSMGFGFVEFEAEEAFKKALEMTGTEMDGRPLRIDAARPKEDRRDDRGERAEAPKPVATEETVDMDEAEAEMAEEAPVSEVATEEVAETPAEKSTDEEA